MTPPPVVVIGSNSISGASFVDYLLKKGESVIGMSRSPEPVEALLPYKMSGRAVSEAFRFLQLDLNHDVDRIAAEIKAVEAAYVVNFAAQSMVAESWLHPDHWYQTNVVANVRLHEKLRRFDFLKKYVHISTPEVYGSCSGNVTEDAPFNPSTPYAASRAACDLHLQTFFKNYRFPVVYTRAANVYGPGQQLYRIIPRTMLFIRLGRKLQLHGGGHSVRSFIHLRDVSEGTYRVLADGIPGQSYHLSTKRFISIRDLVALICQRMGTTFEEVVEVVGDRPGKDAAYLLDATRARTELGWQEQVDLEPGIDEMVAWVDRYLPALRDQPSNYIHKP
ncbi:dTDP-glucose 4,6-dehydratase [Verrucomicrobium sp. GAS474]|uniref:GDP-mannose 4,6-dehydratase n=1 Tax=Verrucomicrobium sp. GAS474 TaxID=1882831 RepID=UPI00087A2553|nr:GDP-mannose 4,6-dehydratase [Verrucomicrobium sp. GAS474]SDT94696.1 dTDP-glucose 4,6-dehydratase [Verrucomicrobium sp. GAS474]